MVQVVVACRILSRHRSQQLTEFACMQCEVQDVLLAEARCTACVAVTSLAYPLLECGLHILKLGAPEMSRGC
jgi:hypothetical protein